MLASGHDPGYHHKSPCRPVEYRAEDHAHANEDGTAAFHLPKFKYSDAVGMSQFYTEA